MLLLLLLLGRNLLGRISGMTNGSGGERAFPFSFSGLASRIPLRQAGGVTENHLYIDCLESHVQIARFRRYTAMSAQNIK